MSTSLGSDAVVLVGLDVRHLGECRLQPGAATARNSLHEMHTAQAML